MSRYVHRKDSSVYGTPCPGGPAPDRRGVSLPPTGVPLFRELRRTLSGPLADRPGALAAQLADGLVEAFELAGRAAPDVEAGDGRVTVTIADSAYGGLDRPDHPVVSLPAVGLAVRLDRPVVVETAEDGRGAHLVTCRFEPTEEPEPVADVRGQADPAEPD